MYSDLYTKLSVDERKVLENYHKKLALSKQSTPKSSSQVVAPNTTKNQVVKKKSLSKQNSSKVFKNKGTLRRASSKTSASSNRSFLKKDENDERTNVNYEVERLLRALYRHSVICPEFKEELKAIGGIGLLDEYLKYRELKSLE
jgi:hypothetical protein